MPTLKRLSVYNHKIVTKPNHQTLLLHPSQTNPPLTIIITNTIKMQFSKAVIAASTLAVDLGNWTLSCGSSCTDGTVIATGDAQYADFGDCQVLDQAYQYCYLDCGMFIQFSPKILKSEY